jgi:DNA replication protein DnaC
MLAAELLYRQHQRGRFNLAWVTPAQIVTEDRESQLGAPRSLLWRASRAQVLVLDELGFGHRDAAGLETIAALVDRRWSSQMTTIYTSHRPFSRKGGQGALEDLCPAIATRLTDGLLINLDGPSQRGQMRGAT